MWGYTDKEDAGSGLVWNKSNERSIKLDTNLLYMDTKNCLSSGKVLQTIKDNYFYNERSYAYKISGGSDKGEPGFIIIISTPENPLYVNITGLPGRWANISGIKGNTSLNGRHKVSRTENINNTTYRIYLERVQGNGNYAGGGIVIFNPRKELKIENNDSTIDFNKVIFSLNRRLFAVKSLSLKYISLPRNIIPITTYFLDFDDYSYTNIYQSYKSFIPQSKNLIDTYYQGFFTTPLFFLRSYIGGAYSLPNQYTPPPLELWNPPQGEFPDGQPQPYPYQTVPTFVSNTFPAGDSDAYLVFSGYGIVDLGDFTYNLTSSEDTNRLITRIFRTFLLKSILQSQEINGIIGYEIVINYLPPVGKWNPVTKTYDDVPYKDPDTGELLYFGFGALQRFIPMPGTGMKYQPTGDPTVASDLSPIPFPNFRGNVWGPYDGPGARFQKMSLRDTLQDLYLNGDLSNLKGLSVISNYIDIKQGILKDSSSANYYNIFNNFVTFENISKTTNYNILNAMRIVSNGFGALSQKVGKTTTTPAIGPIDEIKYKNSGGIGPSTLGPPNAWVNNPVQDTSANFLDPIATSPSVNLNPQTPIPQNVNASYPGNTGTLTHRISWYDTGGGNFVNQILNYSAWISTEVPDVSVVMHIFQAPRDINMQSNGKSISDSIASIPIRLNLGTISGTFQYIEAIQNLLGDSSPYWTKEFNPPLESLEKISISFTTYDGTPISLINTLSPEIGVLSLLFESYEWYYSTHNESAVLGTKLKYNIRMIFEAKTYQYNNPGILDL